MHLLGIILILAIARPPAPAVSRQAELPAVDEVQQRAAAHARLDLGEATEWKRRARLAAYVPRLQLDYGYRMRNAIDVNVNDNVYVGSSGVVVGPEDGTASNTCTADHSVGVRAIWELGEAVFNTKVLMASAEARAIMRDRALLLAEVNRHYHEILKLPGDLALLRPQLAGEADPAKVRHAIFLKGVACQESAAALDALTGGWFTGQVRGPLCATDVIAAREGR